MEANIAALNAGHAYGETAEIGRPLKQIAIRPAPMPAGPVPDSDRERDDRARPGGRKPTRRPADVLGLAIRSRRRAPILHHLAKLKEYDVTTLPGRRRDRGDLLGDRRLLCRPPWRHLVVGSRGRSQRRGARPCDHVRTAAGRRQLPARWAINRVADQDRAVGSLSGGLRPQRRCPVGGHRLAQPVRLLRRRDRGRAAWRFNS